MPKGFASLTILLIVALLIPVGFLFFTKTGTLDNITAPIDIKDSVNKELTTLSTPQNLTLPIKTQDIATNQGVVNPFGVVRSSLDMPQLGHPGIDIPVALNTPIYAVHDGSVLWVKDQDDSLGGKKLLILISPSPKTGEGWAFLYEHIIPSQGLKAGDSVIRGEIIAKSATTAEFTNHLQLSYWFNNFEFSKDNACWVDNLTNAEKVQFVNWFSDYSASDYFINSWRTATHNNEGTFAFKDLLNNPQLCYSEGTDVRGVN